MVSYSSSEMTVLSGIFMVLPVTAVILRFWAVKIRRASFTIDDYIIVPAMVFSLKLSTLQKRCALEKCNAIDNLQICALVVCCVIIYGERIKLLYHVSARGWFFYHTGTVHGAYGSHQALGPDGMVVWNKTLENFYKVCIGFSIIDMTLSSLIDGINSVRLDCPDI